jgi:hypothetical protein
LLAGLVPLVHKCQEKGVTEEKLLSLDDEAIAVLYASDVFAAGSGYQDFAAGVARVVSAVLQNKGTDELGPEP